MTKNQLLNIVISHWKNIDDEKWVSRFAIVDLSRGVNKLSPQTEGLFHYYKAATKLELSRIELKIGNMTRYQTVKSFKKEVLSSIQYILIPSSHPVPLQNEFVLLVESMGLPPPRQVTICYICQMNFNKYTFLSEKTAFDYFGKPVCKQCALEEVKDDFKRYGIELTESTTSFYRQQLNRFKSVEKAVAVLQQPRHRNLKSDSTLFDIIQADKSIPPQEIRKALRKYINRGYFDELMIKNWIKHGYKSILPVQQLAIKQGLLDMTDQLVVAGTSSGKTFLGEMAGLSILHRRKAKFVFITPLVALTNQKYEQFKTTYKPLGLRVVIRVGMTKINVRDQDKVIVDGNIKEADIIVATYEAFDWILRSKHTTDLGEIGCLVIDEVQLLGDEERGQELDGIIARTRKIYPNCQVIALSATIGNPEELADDLNLELVHYNKRPIPLERHIILTEKEEEKPRVIAEIVQNGLNEKSSTGYIGRSLVFTNSRRRAQELSSYLKSSGIRASYYHAGLTYYERKKVETMFDKGQIDAIVTTAALGAGVDFPVSQVVLEKPSMGSKWLTVAEFHQMYGRAGRFGYHDLGKVFLVVTPGAKLYAAMEKSEDIVAFDLLVKDVEPIDVDIDYYKEMEQVLAGISSLRPVSFNALSEYYNILLYNTKQLDNHLKGLQNLGMIVQRNEQIKLSKLGKAVSESFLDPKLGNEIAVKLLREEPIDIAIDLAPFKAIHLSSKAHAELEQALKMRLPSRLLSDTILEALTQGTGFEQKLSKSLISKIQHWNRLFFDCGCREVPYCQHPTKKVTKLLLELRFEGLGPVQINYELLKRHDLSAFPGDIFSWLEEFVHAVETMSRISIALKRDNIKDKISKLREDIVQLDLYKKSRHRKKTR